MAHQERHDHGERERDVEWHCGSQLAIQITTTCIRRCAWFTFHFQYYLGYIMWLRLQGHGVSDLGSFAHYLHHPVEYDHAMQIAQNA
jgi:hypothetical protein